MNNSTERRQQIYDKIKESSKSEYILSEMKRLGFWNEVDLDFEVVEQYLKKENELSKELAELVKQKKLVEDPDAFLANKHKERKLASKQSQKETKQRREKERKEKAEKWRKSKESDIIYLGDGYSHLLNAKETNVDRLKALNLPILHDVTDLAKGMKLKVGDLRFLSYSRKNSKVTHYTRFKMPKKSGGFRLISAPMPKLKSAQHWILEEILNKLNFHEKAHGCVIGRSIKTNADPHVNKAVVINQDMRNFFPSITYDRIKGVFSSFGYSKQISTILALLCSEPKILDVTLLGEHYFAQRGERFLPQGSPCSPAIANIICRKLDFRLNGLATKYGFEYTRYVDDITFSAEKENLSNLTKLLKYSKKIVENENFKLHPDKLRIMRPGTRQEVTGVVVNEKTSVPKNDLMRFKALLFQIEKDGVEGKYWTKGGNLLAQIDGYANFIYQIDKVKGEAYKKRVKLILEKYNYKQSHREKYVKEGDRGQGFFTKLKKTISSWFK